MIITNLFVGSRYPVNRKKIRAKVDEVLAKMGISDGQVDVSIVGDRKIKELNEGKLQHDGVTDVLSFPQHEKNVSPLSLHNNYRRCASKRYRVERGPGNHNYNGIHT